MKRILIIPIVLTTLNIGAADDTQNVTTSSSPSFYDTSSMNGQMSNIAVQNVNTSQRQDILGIVCEGGWNINLNYSNGEGNNAPVYDPNNLGYEARNTTAMIQLSTTVFDPNAKACTDAQRAQLIKLKHSNLADNMHYCSTLYTIMSDAKHYPFNFDKLRKLRATRTNSVNRKSVELATSILSCTDLINLNESTYHNKFANAPKQFKDAVNVVKQQRKVIKVHTLPVKKYNSYRIHYGNFKYCESCMKDRINELLSVTHMDEDRVMVITYYDKEGKPNMSLNLAGFTTYASAVSFGNAYKIKLPFNKIKGYN